MPIDFNNVKRFSRRLRVGGGSRAPLSVDDLPLDHRLSFSPEPDERWTFEDQHIYFNDEEVNGLVNENANNAGFLSGISTLLDGYRNNVWQRGGRSNIHFNGTVAALQGKIVGRLGSLYDGLESGIRFEMTDGKLWLNNVDVTALINLYRLRPTPHAHAYLRGIRDKLALILSRRSDSHRYDGVHGEVDRVFAEIEAVLGNPPAGDPYLLVAHTR